MTDNEISSISDLLRILTELGEPAEGHTRFFRGQGNADWEILPGIYRNQKLVENEDKIIKEALLNCPDDFSPTDTLLEKLVKLQHYGYPTRLLDLTANALVGLYFACSNLNHHDKNGELIILDIPDTEIKYDDSDTVAMIAALSLQNKKFDVDKIFEDSKKIMPLKLFERDIWQFKNELKNDIENIKTFKIEMEERNQCFDEWFNEMQRSIIHDTLIELNNKHESTISLLSVIRNDKNGFQPIINIDDLEKVKCVKVKLNNHRISRQQGCFLIFGLETSKLNPANIPNIWPRNIGNNKIKVKANSKVKILQELKAFGISKQTLFPELESQASEIIAQYSK